MPVSRFVSRPARYILAAVALFAGATCADNSLTGPGTSGLRAFIGLAPAFTKAAADIFKGLVAFQLEVDNIHVLLKHQDGAVAKDTVIALGAGQDSVAIELLVELDVPEALLDAHIELRDGEEVLFSGVQQVRARRGSVGNAASPPVALSYTGPGASATDLSLSPLDTTILATDSVVYAATATDAQGNAVPNLALEWTVRNSNLGSVTIAGVFTPSAVRGNTWVIARLPTNVRDSARITWTPIPSKVVLISGGGQTGIVGRALPQPIVVEVQANDNLPVAGAVVNFAVLSGAGTVTPSSAVTDENGRASAVLSLGVVPGANTVQVSVGERPPITITANANPTGPGQLEIITLPSASVMAGVAFAQQPVVQLRDSLGNLLTTGGLQVYASVVADGRTIGGTTTANTDPGGKATFVNLQVDGLAGDVQLRFTLGDTDVEVLSSALTVLPGHARALSILQQPSGSIFAGTLLLQQPQVQLRDAFGNGVPVAGVPVNVALIVMNEGRTISGATTVNTNNVGLAAFSGLSLGGLPGTTRLVFSVADSVTAAVSNEVSITAGTAAALMAVTSLVSTDTAGGNAVANVLPSVTVRDASNNPVPGVEVKFRRHGGTGASINGQADTLVLLTTDANGNAALTSRRVQTLIGLDTVLVTAAGVNDTLEFVAAVTNGVATALTFEQQPSNTTGGSPIAPPVVVALRDQYGNIAVSGASSTTTVAMALNAAGGAGVLSGTVSVAATAGVAVFPDLSVNLAGTSYSFSASTATITAVSSNIFTVNVGAGALLTVVSGDGQGGLANDLLAQPLVARVTDAGGNPVAGVDVTFAVDSGGGAFGDLIFQTQRTSDANGQVNVPWYLGSGQQLVTASIPGVSLPFRAYVASRLTIVTQPSLNPVNGIVLGTQPAVQLTDDAGHAVALADVTISVDRVYTTMVDAIMTLSGTQSSLTDAAGIATFTDLVLTGQVVQQVQLRFRRTVEGEVDGNIAGVNSSTIVVQPGAAANILAEGETIHGT
ncbi:MAG TPA: hypothetical protein VEB19_05950, partial [Gemmatimonadaceae bacterium]|nr:hypothetical protein [Gemmatimonadaceae bacterium]